MIPLTSTARRARRSYLNVQANALFEQAINIEAFNFDPYAYGIAKEKAHCVRIFQSCMLPWLLLTRILLRYVEGCSMVVAVNPGSKWIVDCRSVLCCWMRI